MAKYGESARGVKHRVSHDDLAASFEEIEDFLNDKAYSFKTTRPGVWRISIDGVLVLFVAEDDRVRIVAPIFALNQLDTEPLVKHALMLRLLQSNFERSIDARYAIFDGIVFATVTHPRISLQPTDLGGFLSQVVNLHKNTFRTGEGGYSSLAPDPESEEVDPRHDESLRRPGEWEHGMLDEADSERMRPTKKKSIPTDDRMLL